MKRLAVALLLAVCLLGLAAFSLNQPYSGFQDEVFLDIRRGTGTVQLSGLLAGAGVVRYRWQFLAARALRPRATLQAGEYRFREPATALDVLDRIARGDVFFYELRVPEGNNIFDIADSLDRLGLLPRDGFLEAARDPSLIRDLAPEAPTLEGYLFPDTYRLTRQTTAAEVCRLMTTRFREAWRSLGADAPVHRAVTLASLVEKETGLSEERPAIASVFHNRVRIGMPLDCDPTTIYAAMLEERYRGTIFRSDLLSRNRYNTYQHSGLPPGPIANPGLESLKAALEPADTPYLYFVARPDGSGRHQFSSELDAHNRAVRNYRRGIQEHNQAGGARPVAEGKPARANR
jgi:UPF0755 protein